MQKGAWIRNLGRRIADGSLPLHEAAGFAVARYARGRTSVVMEGLRFNGVDHVLWSALADVFVNRVYSPPGMHIVGKQTVVDIGAHRGSFTAFAARRTTGTVLAYEPEPENYASLRNLVASNSLRNVHACNVAVGGYTGNAVLHLSKSSSRHSLTRSAMPQEEAGGDIPIKLITLEDSLASLGPIDLLKMDCEGAEAEILMKASDATLENIRSLAAETHYPIRSDTMRAMQAVLKRHFSKVIVVDQGQQDLGYLYAWK